MRGWLSSTSVQIGLEHLIGSASFYCLTACLIPSSFFWAHANACCMADGWVNYMVSVLIFYGDAAFQHYVCDTENCGSTIYFRRQLQAGTICML